MPRWVHEQDFGRTIRDTGEREWGAHRDTEERLGWDLGSPTRVTTGSQPEIPLSTLVRIDRPKLHPATRGQARASYWLMGNNMTGIDKPITKFAEFVCV